MDQPTLIELEEHTPDENKFYLVDTCTEQFCVTDYHRGPSYSVPNLMDGEHATVKVFDCQFHPDLPMIPAAKCREGQVRKDVPLRGNNPFDAGHVEAYYIKGQISTLANTLMLYSTALVQHQKVCPTQALEGELTSRFSDQDKALLTQQIEAQIELAQKRRDDPQGFFASALRGDPNATSSPSGFGLVEDADTLSTLSSTDSSESLPSPNSPPHRDIGADADTLSTLSQAESSARLPSPRSAPQQDLPDNPEPPEPNYVSDNDVDRRAIEDAEFGDYGIKPDGEYKVDVTYFRPTLEVKINPANLLVLATQMISPESGDPAQQAAKWMNVANATWALGEGADQFTHAWTEYLAGRRTRGELYKVWMETISAGGKIAAGAGTATLKSKSPIYAAGVGTTDVGSYDDQRIDRTLERQIHQARQQPPQTPPGDIEAPPSEQRQAAQSDDPRRSQGSAAESWSTFFRETQGNGNILRSLLRFNPMTIGLARKALEGGVNFATNFKLGAGISLAKPLDIAPEVLFPILHGKLPLSQRGAQALPPNLDLVEVITNIGRIHFQDADAGRAAKAALALELASFIYYTGQVSTGNMDTILYEVYATGPDGEKTGKPLHSYTYPPSHQMPGVGTREQLMQLYPHHRTHPVSRQGRIRGRDYVSALNELHNQIDRKNLQAFAIFQTRRAQIIQNRQGLVEKLLEVLPDPARRLAADHLDDLLQDATWDNRHTLDGVPDELQRSRGFALYNFKLILLEQLKQQDPVKDILTRNGYPQQFLLHKLNKPDEFNEKFTKLRKVVDDHILPAIHPQLTLVGQANDKQRAAFALLQSPKFLQMINQKATSDRFAQLLSLKRQLISAYYGFAPDNPAGLFSQKKSLDHIHECVGTICAQIEDRLQNKNVDLDQRTLRDALAGLDSLESAMKTGHKHVHDLYRDILAAERKPTPGLLSTWRETFTQPLITLRSMVNPPKYGAERGAREAEAWLKLGGTRLSVAVPNAFTSLSFFQDLGRLGSSVRQIVRSARAVPPSAEVGPSEVPSSTGGRTRYIWGEGAYIEPDPYRPISNVADPYVRVAPAPDTNSSQPKASPSTPRIRGGRLHLTGSASSPSSRCGLAVPYLASTLDHLSSQLNYLHSQLDLLYVLQGSAY